MSADFAAVTACTRCGQSFKVGAEHAGKPVRCPHCRTVIAIPLPEPAPAPVWRMLLPPVLLAVVLWSSFVLKLYNLEHSALTRWDEVFHAIVAQNVMKHPLRPTLVDRPFLPYDHQKWGENHVWLHKPILPFWQIALSFAVLGVHPFALRLPSALLSTGAAWLTYLIGKELFDRRAALVAASLQAINPFVVTLVHGYQFADQVDIALLFWTEVGVYFLLVALRTGSWRCFLLAGGAQGCAYLSKSYLAAIIVGIALTAWLLPYCRLCTRDQCRVGVLRLMAMMAVTLLAVAPWVVHCTVHYPDEFRHEEWHVWQHLGANVENWAAPWDRLVFDYLIAIHGVFYTPILVAGLAYLDRAFLRKHRGLWLCYAWTLGVMLPHVLATSKTPSATLIAMPAMLLLLGYLVAEASRFDRWSLAVLTGMMVMSLVLPAVVRRPGHGYPFPRGFATILLQTTWVLYHVAGALAIAALLTLGGRLLRGRLPVLVLCYLAVLFCVGVLGWLGIRTLNDSWRVVDRDENDAYSVEAGEFARKHLPEETVLLCEQPKGYEHLSIMFYADRTCYPLPRSGLDEMALRIQDAGGIPHIVTRRKLAFPVVHASARNGPTIYRWQR